MEMTQRNDERDLLRRLGERIRQFRLAKALTQEDLSDIAGVHRTYIGMIERGEKNITVLSAQKISDALGISLSVILEGLDSGQ